MTVNDFIEIYREKQAPILGRDYIDGFIARNRARLERMIEPVVALINARAAKAAAKRAEVEDGVLTILRAGDGRTALSIRVRVDSFAEASRQYRHYVEESGEGASTFPTGHLRLNGRTYEISYNGRVWEIGGGGMVYAPEEDVEDPDAVTPEKDAIVWAAFMGLVNEKRRAFGMEELEVTESLPFFGRRKPDRRELIEFIREIKETRRSDWRLAEVLAMHFEVPEKKVVEWLNEYNICPGATTRTMASKCDPSRYKAPAKSEGWLSRQFSGRPKRDDLLKVIRELKHERRGDWMLVPTLAGHFGVPDVTVVEWLRFHKICPRATAESMASQCVVEDVESLPSDRSKESQREAARLNVQQHREKIGVGHPLAIMLKHPTRRDLTAMVTASASEPGRFQLTWVDDEGPSGHTTRDTPEEAVRYAVDEGYRFHSANTAEARAMVERVQQAREDRAAEIESWLTESLPSGTCGRTPKERRQAEHIAEIYEDRELDARTSKSRGCATVNARRNERMESLPTGAQDDDTGLNEARQSLATRGLTNPIAEGIASGWGLNGAPTYWFMFKRSMAASEWLRESGLVVAVVSATVDGGYSATVLRLTPDEANRLVVMLRRPDLVVGHRWHGHLAAALRETTKLMNTVGGGGSIVGAVEPDEGGAILVASVAGDGSDEMQPHLHVLFLGYGGDGDHAIDLERSGVARFVDAMTRSEAVESLPKNVGRKGDGFRVGEHVIRIGDEIKMEGQLGGYVRSVDRGKGTAVIEQDNDEVKTWPIASLLHDTAANRQHQQDYNDKINADAEAQLERSLANWRAL